MVFISEGDFQVLYVVHREVRSDNHKPGDRLGGRLLSSISMTSFSLTDLISPFKKPARTSPAFSGDEAKLVNEF